MSRVGRKPIEVPAGLKVKLENGVITITNGKETLSTAIHPEMTVEVQENQILVTRPSDDRNHRAMHGLTRSLVNNMVVGLTKGFEKKLEINGIGYKAAKNGKKLVLNLGYSHPIEMEEPAGITIEVPQPNTILVKGSDKQLVGETAAKIRAKRLPDAYKGKGIKYDYEVLHLKEGKTGAKSK